MLDMIGYWAGWSAWGACSSVCGAGSRMRRRICQGNCSLCQAENSTTSSDVASATCVIGKGCFALIRTDTFKSIDLGSLFCSVIDYQAFLSSGLAGLAVLAMTLS